MWVWRSVVSGGDGKTLLASLAAAALLLGCTGPAPDAASARAPADPSADWLATAQRAIAEREYHASESEGVLQAPNRAHNLRTWFEPSGIRVHDRTAGGSPALVELRLAGVGRPGELKAPAEGEVLGEADRIEIRRGELVEWFENTPQGLEQGFTLSQRPTGAGSLVLELAVRQAKASLRGEAVSLATQAGRRLGYGKLVALDADGRVLSARFEVPAPERIRLVVDDADARYPLMIDPLLTETADTLLESNQASSELGISVASAGDVNDDGFDDVIVGANAYDAGQSDEGAAFVFLGSANGIADASAGSAQAQLESNQTSARLGFSVAGAGDVNGDGYADVIVGASFYDSGQSAEGAAFVFLGSANGIADGNPATAHAQLESNQASGFLGQSVAGAGDVNGDGYADVIVGANAYDSGQSNEGAAFVFLGSANGIADGNPTTAHAQLESDQVDANLGRSVASTGDVNGDGYADVIIGAAAFDGGQTDEGAAFVFLGGATGIADANPTNPASRLESNQIDARLGSSVASAGDVNADGYGDVIVGAPFYDNGQSNEGAAFLFHGSADGIQDAIPLTANAQLESNQVSAFLGWSVASAGDVNGDGYSDVIVSSLFYDNGQTDEGAAFVFLGSASGVADGNPASAHAQLESDQASAQWGFSVASAGDVNGDGYADVIVGANSFDNGQTNEGAAFVFLGAASGMADGNPANAHAQLESDQDFAFLGQSVASAGDLNGDGYADVIVGANAFDSGQTDEGAAFVFLGGASGVGDGNPGTAHAQLESNQATASLGSSVASAGDVNGDGYADVIVGARAYDNGQIDEGAAFVFLGGASGLADGSPASAHAQLESDQLSSNLGSSVASAGDVNGDGFSDVIVGAPAYDNPTSNEGAAFVFLGSANGLVDGNPATAHAQLESDQVDTLLGQSVASAGDVNGDGFSEVIVGADSYDSGQGNEGAAFVFQGGGTGDGRPVRARQLRGDGSGIAVQPWGAEQSGRFAVELQANHPHGTGRVKLQIEACPQAVPFGDASCTGLFSSSWIAVNGLTPDVSIAQTVTGLAGEALYRWRARVLQAPSTGPIAGNPTHGPWRRVGGQSVEADIRLPEPGIGLSLVGGAGLLAMLVRRRARGGS
jgi:hypothetical protein